MCNHKALFIDCFIGMPGRMHDARVFRSSKLYNEIINAERPLISENMHLIGDSAYPLLKNLMTPIRDNGHLTLSQIRYNTKLCSIRSIIERTFGLLKTKFRRLKYLDISDFELGNNMIGAACVLHNFIIINDGIGVEEDHFNEENVEIQEDDIIQQNEQNLQAIEKRTQIVGLF